MTKSNRQRSELVERLAEMRSDRAAVSRELSKLTGAPGAMTNNATRISLLADDLRGRDDEIGALVRQVEALDQAAILANRKSIPMSGRAVELTSRRDALLETQRYLTEYLDGVRANLVKCQDALSPAGLISGYGNLLRMVSDEVEAREVERRLIIALGAISAAVDECSKQINSEMFSTAISIQRSGIKARAVGV